MKNTNTDIMEYLDGMEVISHDILNKVDSLYNSFDYNRYTAQDVKTALSKDILDLNDFAVLLSPVANEFLEDMAKRAKKETFKHFGNAIGVYTPLYIANYCESHCVYCGFNCMNKIHRAKLTEEEIERELKAIAGQGFKEILLLTGESRKQSSVEYIGKAVTIAKKYFSTIGVEIYPLNSDEYAYLNSLGADYVSVYQETYNKEKYAEQHLRGAKRVFPYRFNAQERALIGGMRGVCFGALLGLDDWRKDAFAVGCHAYLVQKKYPHAEISFSCPRMRPYINNSENNPKDVHERQLLQVILAYRLLMPYATINISTREKQSFRDGVIGLACNKISAGSKVGVGGHDGEEKGDEQFDISDPRDLIEVNDMLEAKGLQPIFTDSQYLI
ncbi:MAG: 2-iminoacetate synthase ThiH [Clostridia bacterium]|nr:2-iminoacetate synthase ThiH [Clostridia bacterium]